MCRSARYLKAPVCAALALACAGLSAASLVFRSGDPSGTTGGPLIDGVSVTAADNTPAPVVPEAPFTALLAVARIGAAGLVVARRRRA